MNPNNLANIDNATVDAVVIGAMAMLVESGPCMVSPKMLGLSDDITVAVYCDSNQQSAVVLRCSYALAKSLTCAMLEMQPDEIGMGDMVDATGELVNVIAGNLRGLVESPGKMTAPFIIDPEAFTQFDNGVGNTYCLCGEDMQLLRM